MLTNKPKTKLLVDGGDPEETLRIKSLIGFVDGQTTILRSLQRIPRVKRLVCIRPQIEFSSRKKRIQ